MLQKNNCSGSGGVGGVASFRRAAASLILAKAFFQVIVTEVPLRPVCRAYPCREGIKKEAEP